MTTKIRELIDRLESLALDMGDDTPVLVAYQPSWPLAGELDGVASSYEMAADGVDFDPEDEVEPVVWIAVGGHPDGRSPYAPRGAWDSAYV